LRVPLAPPLAVDQSLLVIGASGPGGWVEGPRIKGKLVGPAGDWLRVMPSGVLRQDVRGTIQTDTNDLIFISYNSAIQCSKEQMDRFKAGEELNWQQLGPGSLSPDRTEWCPCSNQSLVKS